MAAVVIHVIIDGCCCTLAIICNMSHVEYTLLLTFIEIVLKWIDWNAIVCYELLSDWNWKDSVEWAHWVDGDEGGTEREVNHDWKTGMWTFKMRMQCESCIIFFTQLMWHIL